MGIWQSELCCASDVFALTWGESLYSISGKESWHFCHGGELAFRTFFLRAPAPFVVLCGGRASDPRRLDSLAARTLAARILASRILASRTLASRILASRTLASRTLASRTLASRTLASRTPASFGSRVFGSRVFGSRVFGSRVFGSRVFGSRKPSGRGYLARAATAGGPPRPSRIVF